MITKTTGYECDICHKTVVFSNPYRQPINTIVWTHPVGNLVERSETEKIEVCSLHCFLIALSTVYFDAEIHLSSDLIAETRNLVTI